MKLYVFALGLCSIAQLSASQGYLNALKVWESASGKPDATITIKRDEYRDLLAQNMQLKKDNESVQAEVKALKTKVEQLEKQLQKK